MKHEIKEGDGVYFLYYQHLTKGIVRKVNKKTYSIFYTTWGWDGTKGVNVEHKKLVAKDRVIRSDDEFTVVWEQDIGVQGRYYITHDEYPESNAPGPSWHQPYTYLVK